MENTGDQDGAEVVQLYIRAPRTRIFKPEKELRAFRKVYIKAGESAQVELTVKKDDLRYYHTGQKRWIMEPGEYEFQLCSDCCTVQLSETLSLAGEKAESPYSPEAETVYGHMDLAKVTDELFTEMSGIAIPKLPASRPVTLESRFTDLNQSFLGRILFRAVLSVAEKQMKEAERMPEGTEKDNKRKGAVFLKRILESNSLISMSMSAGKLMPVTGILLFTVPRASETVQVIWIMVSYNLFYSIAYTIYNMSHTLMVPLSTRNTTERGSLSVFNNIATVMMSGIIVALVFPMIIMPALGVNRNLWLLVMSILAILILPLTLLEYFFTKERITAEGGETMEVRSIREELRAVLHDRYWVILILYLIIYTLGTNFKNASLVYYCNYVLGTYNDGITQTMLSVIGGLPMGIGIFAVWPLARKFGKRNVTMAGFILYATGSLICCLAPRSMVVVLTGQFIKNIGGLPSAYVFMALFADVLDHIEWKYGFRCDGISTSVNTIVATVCMGVSTGILNLCLSLSGYVAPEYNEITQQTTGFVQNAATQNVFIFFFVGLEVITAVIVVILLKFLNVEKDIEKEQEEIKARKENGGKL